MRHTREEELAELLRGQASIVQEAYSILEQADKQDELVRAAIRSTLKRRTNHLPVPDPSRIFSLEDIRSSCIRYRLRFLPSGRFRGTIPHEAVHAVRRLEARAGHPVHGFMIMAPAKRFQLCDCDADPMLFVPLADGTFYLAHQWGREISPWRAALGWPVRTWRHLAVSVVLASAIFSALLPTAWLTNDVLAGWWGGFRFGAFFCTTMMACAATAFGWMAFFGQFSTEAWDSRTFN